ncbi:hypothetical protein C9374_007569 [Naegleria lovaniensis]|uniref:Uncharacterized protein n=1 Tax=Naegleria lovaniensis TaxID=51637 RepID=A0AA88G4J0_NAELO|nr:uncharacterized protein C9374_014698 [Naegleria lovaniensis]XP_044546193.1 uncharacterized protein C9374_007569 [Naegleria lovaniensis]KAG2370656.1 hypothetical protein C9374_014698 [Naegleria lovaniensis]KAG2378931.1 hypothetical protein C9374_007569 [Naegleria lovaniensis]
MDDEKNNKKTTGVVVMEEGCDIGGLLMNLEALTADVQNLVQTPFPIFEFFEKLKQSMPYVSNHSCEHEQEFHFPKDHPFESFEELCCFMLINHFGISKQAYNFMIQMLKSTFKDRPELMKLFVSYDTLKARGNNLNPQKPMQFNDNFILYSVQDTIRNMLMDPYLVNQLCLNREKHQQQFATKQPFQSKIFNKILEKCQSDIFPLVMLIYVDDFVKFRTKSTSTCGVYSSLLNFNSDFMRKLESISLLGFSKTHCDFWTMTSHLMKEINHLDGEIIEIEDPSTGESRKFQIVVAGFLWDTVEKMYSLQLMKEECSRCEGIYDNQHKTPDCLFGASTIEDPKYVTHFEKRNIFEANTVINSIDLRSNDRTKDKGFKPLIWEEMQFKDLKLSKAKITQKLRELPVLHIKCIPQLMLSAIDISKVKSKCSCICYSLPSGLKWQLNQFAFCYNFCK